MTQALFVVTAKSCKVFAREWSKGFLHLSKKIHIPSLQKTQKCTRFINPSNKRNFLPIQFASFSTNVLGEAVEQESLGSEEEIIEVEKKFFSQLPGIDLPLRRTFLYVPASDERKIRKSATLDVDVVCFDLEDGVAESEKKEARDTLVRVLPQLKFKFPQTQVFIRINSPSTSNRNNINSPSSSTNENTKEKEYVKDIRKVLGNTKYRPHGIVIPKCEGVEEIEEITKLLAEYENRHFVNPLIVNAAKDSSFQKQLFSPKPRKSADSSSDATDNTSATSSKESNAVELESNSKEEEEKNILNKVVIPKFNIICGIETPKGLINLTKILEADDRIEGIVFGGEDFRASIGSTYSLLFNSFKHTRHSSAHPELLSIKMDILTKCAAKGVYAIDMINKSVDLSPSALDDVDSALDELDESEFESELLGFDLEEDDDLSEIGKNKKIKDNTIKLFKEAKESISLGFVGKQIIHPDQIPIVMKAFAPSLQETLQALRIVRSFLQHQKLGIGAFKLDGMMIDYPIAIQAAKIIQRARLSGDLSPLNLDDEEIASKSESNKQSKSGEMKRFSKEDLDLEDLDVDLSKLNSEIKRKK